MPRAHVCQGLVGYRPTRPYNERCGTKVGVAFVHAAHIVFAGTVYEEELFYERIMDVLDTHNDTNKPLFLFYGPKIAHYPLQAPKEYQDRFSFITEPHRRVYHAMVTYLDEQLGNITQKLKDKVVKR